VGAIGGRDVVDAEGGEDVAAGDDASAAEWLSTWQHWQERNDPARRR